MSYRYEPVFSQKAQKISYSEPMRKMLAVV